MTYKITAFWHGKDINWLRHKLDEMGFTGLDFQIEEEGEFTPITSVCKDDILQAFNGRDDIDKVKERLKKMDKSDMVYLAREMADSHTECCYWEALRGVFKYKFLEDGK